MRIYIIGNEGIILCREPPPELDEGEILVASNNELHAAQLSGKRLLTLWNALPGVEKRKRDQPIMVGNRTAAGPGAAIGREAHLEAGGCHRDAASIPRRNGR